MSAELQLALGTDAERYAALFRISEALSACGEPEQLARVLADQLRGLSVSTISTYSSLRKFERNRMARVGNEAAAFPNLPVEETSSWHVYKHRSRAIR